MDSGAGLRLLCLDGGGIRGLSELIILKAIMDRVQTLLHLETPPLPADYFDLIGGTSTGGLIAVLLGRLRMSIDEAIESYEKFSRTIFGKKQRLRDGKYSAKTFESIIKGVVSTKLGDESASMRQSADHTCKSFVCTVSSLNVPRTRLFRSYRTNEVSEHDCTIWEAVRATCAAPTYFSSIKIGPQSGKEEFIDGGVGSNNPINELHEEADRLFTQTREVACIVSLGTGVRNTIQVEQAHLLDRIVLPRNIIKGFKKLALDSERNAKMMGQKYAQVRGLYFRLSVEKGLEKIRLADWEKLAEVRTHTLAYLDDPSISAKVHEIARALAGLDRGDKTHNYTLAHLSMSTETVIQATLDSMRSPPNPRDLHFDWLFPSDMCSVTPSEDQVTNLKKRFRNNDTMYKTCEWFFQTEQFSNLSEAEKPSILWIKGPTGCGKSVQASVIIDRLQEKDSSDKASIVLYFYCHSHPESTTSMMLVRGLLAQSIEFAKPDVLREIDSFHAQNIALKERDRQLERELWDLLSRVISSFDEKLFVIVDGVDECIGTSGQPAERLISLIARSSGVKKPSLLLFSSFDGATVFESEVVKPLLDRNTIRVEQLQMTPQLMEEDLKEFVKCRINDTHSPLRRKPQKTRDDIFRRICERANGIILYANLALEELKGDKISSVSAIQKTLDKLPDGLYEIYERNLHVPRNAIKGAEAFCWLFASNRPLTWHELKSGLAIVEFEFSEDDLVEDSCELFIQHSCGQLVEAFGEQKDKIRFIHPNVPKFLANSVHGTNLEDDLGISKAQVTVACKLLACLKYKDLPTFYPFDGSQPQKVVETYSQKPGRGLLSYAVFNWYRHLCDSDKSTNSELEEQLSGFLMSPASINWLKCAMVLSYFARDGTNSIHFATDVIDCLERWMRQRSWGEALSLETNVRQWIRDFQALMLDWGALLERHPFWIHFIHYQFLPEDNLLRQIIERDSTESVITFESEPFLTKSSEKASWPQRCFAIDPDRDFAYVLDENFLQCYHMQTDLLTAEIEMPMPEQNVVDYCALSFKKGVLCPQKRFLALLFEAVDLEQLDETSITSGVRGGLEISFNTKSDRPAWILENEANHDETTRMAESLGVPKIRFFAYLVELEYSGTTRTSLFGLPNWTETPFIATSSQRIKWEVDDTDTLAFSPDSLRLALPNGILNLMNGKFERSWSYGLDHKLRGPKIPADFKLWAAIRNRNMIELRSLQQELNDSLLRRIQVLGSNHLLAISNKGRFILILKVHDFHEPQMRKTLVHSEQLLPQQGTIGVFDCSKEIWIPLLVLQPPFSQRLAPWQVARCSFEPRFCSEAQEGDQVNQILIQIPPAWKVAPEVRRRTELTECANPKHHRILVFESEKFSDGFGTYPSLKLAIPLQDTRSPFSKTELNLLQFMPDLKHVISQSEGKIVTRSVEDVQVLCQNPDTDGATPAIDKATTEASSIKATAKDGVLLISPEKSNIYRARVTRLDHWDHHKTNHNELDLVRIQSHDLNIVRLTTTHHSSPTSYYPPRALQYASVTEFNRLVLGNLELAFSSPNDGNTFVMKDAGHTFLQKALRSFKKQAHPLQIAQIPSHENSLVKKDVGSPDSRYAIFQNAEIVLGTLPASDWASEDEMHNPKQSWQATGTLTEQAGHCVVQVARPFEKETPSEKQRDACQHEIFICIYDERIDRIVWSLHTLTAGGANEGESDASLAAWAIHPKTPLVTTLIPGHKLRISHFQSGRPPINIAEPLSIEADPSQALKFSPGGRYLLAQAHITFRNAFLGGRAKGGDAGSLIVFDLVQGKSTSLALTSNSLLSFDIDDDDLKILRLTRQGFVEMNKYKLPDLVEFDRQHLAFLPADCRCATCGDLLKTRCNIFVSEHHGVKSIILSHQPINIGSARANTQVCDPLILRVTAPSIPIKMEQISDTIVTVNGTGAFHPVLNNAGDIRDSAFDVATRTEGRLKTVHQNPIDEYRLSSSSEVWTVKDIVPLIHNFRDATGVIAKGDDSSMLPEAVESFLDVIEKKVIERLKFGADSEKIRNGSLQMVREATKGFFPYDSWADFREMMAQTAERGLDFDKFFNDWFEPGNRGIGCQSPVLIHTFHFKTSSVPEATDFDWSACMDVAWIEEDAEWFFERFFEDKFENARTWYVFPGYADLVGNYREIKASSSPKAQRIKKYFGPELKGFPELPSQETLEKATGSSESSDEDLFDEILDSLGDMCAALSDLMPGMGKAMELRLRRMLTRSIIELDD